MPRTLRVSPPSSSVARLFDANAASRALAAPETSALVRRPELGEASSRLEPPLNTSYTKREVTLCGVTDEAFSRLLQSFRESTGTRLSASHLIRALLHAVSEAVPSIEASARRLGRMRLPGNGRGTNAHRETFERKIALALLDGIRCHTTRETR